MLRSGSAWQCHRAAVPRTGVGCLVAGVALLGGAVIAGLAVWNLKPSPLSTPQTVARMPVTVPADEELIVVYPAIAVSPNGAHLVYVASRRGVQQLHLRAIDSWRATALVGTEGAVCAVLLTRQPVGGFFAEGKLKKIPVTGGASQIVCDAGTHLAEAGHRTTSSISRRAVSLACGRFLPTGALLSPSRDWSRKKERLVIDGRRSCREEQAVLFTSRTGPGTDEWHVQVQRVSNGERRMLAQGGTGYYVPTGHLVYVQVATGTLVAMPFDLQHFRSEPPRLSPLPRESWLRGKARTIRCPATGCWRMLPAAPTLMIGRWSGWIERGRSTR